MQLPGAQNAVVEPRKLRDYLLSTSHPVGRTKAEFFLRIGYKRENWHQLAADLRALIAREAALHIETTVYGTKFEVRGRIVGPRGEARIVTAWIILEDEDFPRFVTAYPE